MTRAQLEDAIVACLEGLSDGVLVYIEKPKAPTPDAYPYITLRIEGSKGGLGMPWKRAEVIPDGEPGADLEVTYIEPGNHTVSLHAYTEDTQGDACAVAILERVRAGLNLKTKLAPLHAAGVTLNTRGAVVDVGEVVEGGWRGHAQMDLEVGVFLTNTERITWIEKVRAVRITTVENDLIGGATNGELPPES